MVTVFETLQFALPDILFFAITAVAWMIIFRLSLDRHSRGLLLISRGFLARLIIDGSWAIVYYIIIGGPIGIFNLIRNQSSLGIALTFAIFGWTGTAISLAALSIMVYFIIKGTLLLVNQQQLRETMTLPTSPQ